MGGIVYGDINVVKPCNCVLWFALVPTPKGASRVTHPDAASLLAADVIALEDENRTLRREVDIYRVMLSESLAYTHDLLRALFMATMTRP